MGRAENISFTKKPLICQLKKKKLCKNKKKKENPSGVLFSFVPKVVLESFPFSDILKLTIENLGALYIGRKGEKIWMQKNWDSWQHSVNNS